MILQVVEFPTVNEVAVQATHPITRGVLSFGVVFLSTFFFFSSTRVVIFTTVLRSGT